MAGERWWSAMPMRRPVQEDVGRSSTTLNWKPPMGTVGIMAGIQWQPVPFMRCLHEMSLFLCRHMETEGEIMYEWAPMTWFPAARNWLVEHMHGDWLFFCDTDHTFEPDLLSQMLPVLYTATVDDKPIEVVSCVYFQRHPPHRPLVYKWDDRAFNGQGSFVICDSLDFDGGGNAMKVAAVGGGGLLVKRSVFERIRNELREAPFDIVPIAVDVKENQDGDYVVTHGPALSEDLSFCMRLRRLGIPIVLLTDLSMGHLITGCVDKGAHLAAIRGLEKVTERADATGAIQHETGS